MNFDKKELTKQLTVAFGDKKAKELIKEILDIKKKNPKQAYNFIFKEDGTFLAIKKESQFENDFLEEEENFIDHKLGEQK